ERQAVRVTGPKLPRQVENAQDLVALRVVNRRRRAGPAVEQAIEVLGREELHRMVDGERRPDGVRADRALARQVAWQEAGPDRDLERSRGPARPQEDPGSVAQDGEVPA